MTEQLESLTHIQQSLIDSAIQFGPKLLVAIVIILVGFYVGRWVGRVAEGGLTRLRLESPVRDLLVRILRILVLMLFTIMALQNLGVELLPLIAGLGVAGAGIALAMQGVLSNIVAGLTIIFTKPFSVGEYISIVGEEGEVEKISLFTTILSHTDHSRIVIPNRKLVGEILHNYGYIRQLDIKIGVAYETDLDMALVIVDKLLKNNPHVLQEPTPLVHVDRLADSSINIAVKPWVEVPNYVAAHGVINKALVEAFREGNIAIPFPQREVRMLQAAGTK